MNEIEIWKDIQGYENYYQVSNLGNVKSLRRTIIRKNTNIVNGLTLRWKYRKRGAKAE